MAFEPAVPPEGAVVVQSAERPTGYLFLVEPGVLVFQFRAGVRIEEDDALDHFQAMAELGGERHLPALVRINSARVTPAARRIYASDRALAIYPAIALIAESRVSVMLANFFMRVSKPKVKARMFTELDEGMAWVVQYSRQRAH